MTLEFCFGACEKATGNWKKNL